MLCTVLCCAVMNGFALKIDAQNSNQSKTPSVYSSRCGHERWMNFLFIWIYSFVWANFRRNNFRIEKWKVQTFPHNHIILLLLDVEQNSHCRQSRSNMYHFWLNAFNVRHTIQRLIYLVFSMCVELWSSLKSNTEFLNDIIKTVDDWRMDMFTYNGGMTGKKK